jgi:hypothetical protein
LRHYTFGYVVLGLLLMFVSASLLSRSHALEQNRSVFLTILFLGAAVLCWRGLTRLSLLKKEMSDVTWWQFLKIDLIATGVMALLITGYCLLPGETRQNIRQGLRDFVGTIRAMR